MSQILENSSNNEHLKKDQAKKQLITKIEVQKRNKERFNVFINHVFSFGISESVLAKFGLYKGKELDSETIDDIKVAEIEFGAYQEALSFLTHRLRTEKEIRDHLSEKEYSPESIDQAMQKLSEMQLINDSEYAAAYTRTANRAGKKGPKVIQRDLITLGVSKAILENIEDHYPIEDQLANAIKMAQKFFKSHQKESKRLVETKARTFLIQKGFSPDIGQSAISTVLNEVELLTDEERLAPVAEKYFRKYSKRFSSYNLDQKTREALLRKGFSNDLISQWLKKSHV